MAQALALTANDVLGCRGLYKKTNTLLQSQKLAFHCSVIYHGWVFSAKYNCHTTPLTITGTYRNVTHCTAESESRVNLGKYWGWGTGSQWVWEAVPTRRVPLGNF